MYTTDLNLRLQKYNKSGSSQCHDYPFTDSNTSVEQDNCYLCFCAVYHYLTLVVMLCASSCICIVTTIMIIKACRVRKVSGEVQSFSYLLQRIAVAVQRGNAVSSLDTFVSKVCLVFEDSDT